MNAIIKTGIAAILLIAISCKKENNSGQSVALSDENSTRSFYEPGKFSSVTIGNQEWMKKNLDVSRYRNGDTIPQVTDKGEWKRLSTGAWCWYNNNSATGAVYGKLYNWYAVNDPRGLAPLGWHIPSDAEWTTLSTFLGSNAGGKMKEKGTTHWMFPNSGATNETGFKGLPGGFRSGIGAFESRSYNGRFWSSTKYDSDFAFARELFYDGTELYRNVGGDYKVVGYSVRCIKD